MYFVKDREKDVPFMRYIGGKSNLLTDIEQVISTSTQNVNTIIDIFSGSGAVSSYLKSKNYNVLGNDIMYFSYVLSRGTTATKKRLGEFSYYEMRKFIESEPYIKEKFEKELKRQEEEADIDGPTRKQMVDFLYSCNIYANGKRVTKKSLNAQPYGVLSEMINSSDKAKKAFEESIRNPQKKKKLNVSAM